MTQIVTPPEVIEEEISSLSDFKNPDIACEILNKLYHGPMRSQKIVDFISEKYQVSKPTVYGVLKDLDAKQLIKKDRRSPRRVTYKLTEKGFDFFNKEFLHIKERLIHAIESAPNQKEIIAEVLLKDLMEELPKDWRTPEKKELFRVRLKKGIEDMLEREIKWVEVEET